MSVSIIDAMQVGVFTDGDTYTHIRAGTVDAPGLSCDAVADLPAQAGGLPGYFLEQGSAAHVIADNTIYCIKSDGTWIRQDAAARMDVYTKEETNNLVDTEIQHQAAIQAVTDNTQTSALAYIIDNDIRKNVMPKVKRVGTSNSNASTTYTIGGITFTVNADGTVDVSRASAGTSQAVWLYMDSGAIRIDDFCDGTYIFSTGTDAQNFNVRLSQLDSGNYMYVTTSAVIPDRGSYTGINVSISIAAAFSGSFTLKPMICAKSLYDITDKFVTSEV